MSGATHTDLGPGPSDSAELRRVDQETALLNQRLGLVVGGRYKILRTLGAGGMGGVYEGVHELIGRKVAIKCLHGEFAKDQGAVERFRREARAATAIGNDHIIDVTDVGELPDGAPYLVMEFLVGTTLGGAMAADGAMHVPRVVRIARQIASALAAAHDKGIVHRDLKPDNVFLIRRGDDPDFVKVLDFGISKTHASDPNVSDLTRTGMAIGTPSYMSPEQAQGLRDVDARTDIWALGVILYEMLTERRPFVADTYPRLLMQIVGSAPRPVTQWRRDVPEGLDALVMRCLEKSVASRVQTMHELAAALLPFAGADSVPELAAVDANGVPAGAERSAEGQAARRVTGAGDAPLPAATGSSTPSLGTGAVVPATTTGTSEALPVRSRAPLLGGVVAVLVGLALVLVWARGSGEGPASAPVTEVTRAADPRPSGEPIRAATPRELPAEPTTSPSGSGVATLAPDVAIAAPVLRRIESDPSGATVERGGVSLGVTPIDVALEGSAPVELTLRLAGRRTTVRLVGPEDPDVVVVRLPARRVEAPLPQLAPH